MNRILLFIFSLFLCTNLFAQDWQLFNTNYITYYRIYGYSNLANEKIDKIFEFQFDKEIISENNLLYTSARIKPKNYYDSCLLTIRQKYNVKAFSEDNFLIDMYKIFNDTLYCYDEIFGEIRQKNAQFDMPLNMNENDSLICGNVKIKFKEAKQVEVFKGLYDSAKVFAIEYKKDLKDTISYFTLTQHYGLLDYVYFKDLFYNQFTDSKLKLCGLKKIDGSESFGYIPKKCNISNLLNLKVGDYKIWRTEIEEMGKNDEVYYLKDVCNSVTFKEDSIIIEYIRTQYKDEKPGNSSIVRETYVKSLWVEMCSNRQNTTHLINIIPNYNQFNIMGISIVEGAGYLVYQDSSKNSNASFIEYTDNGEYLIGECESSYITDHYNPKIISTEVGALYSRGLIGLGEGSITNEVIGYSLDGKQYGEIPNYLSINENTEVISSISPNPASDYINVDMSFMRMQESKIEIYNIFGNEMYPPRQTSSDTPQEGNFKIDISSLPAGVYFVKIGGTPKKFVVVR